MENSIINFNFEGNGIRVIKRDGEPWFAGVDIANALQYGNAKDAINNHVDAEDKRIVLRSEIAPLENHIPRDVLPMNFIPANFPNRGLTFINESGVYSLILRSNLPKAKEFKHWVTSEVLPSIRKNGGYIAGQENLELTDDEIMARALVIQDRILKERAQRIANLEAENSKLAILTEAQAETIAVMKPKADYYDQILSSKDTMLATQIAKDYGMAAVAFNKMLNAMKIQYKAGNQWVLYQNYADHGYTRSETHVGGDGFRHWSSVQTKWTQEGRLFLYKILKKNGILPMCERDQETSK